jgi:hypothetical protein
VLALARLLLPLVPMQPDLGSRKPDPPGTDYATAAGRAKSVVLAKIW